MNKRLIAIFFLLCFFQNINSAEIKNKIVATVDNNAITSIDLINEIKLANIISGGKLSKMSQDSIKNYAIRTLINKSIKQNEIQKYNIPNISSSELDSEITKIANKFKLLKKDLYDILKKENIPLELLNEEINLNSKWNYLIFQLYKDKITIDENEVINQLNEFKKKQNIIEYNLSEILLNPVNSEFQKDKITEAMLKIQKDGFAQTALEISTSNSSTNNGSLGWLKETEISIGIKKIIEPLNIGEVSDPIFLPEGIMLIKLDDKREIINVIDLEVAKKNIASSERNKKLNFFSILHFQKLKNSSNTKFY